MPSQADSRNLRPCAGSGTGAAIRAIRDVAVVPTGTDDATADDFRDHPPAEGVDLGRGLTIERLSDADYKLVMAAARPRGHFGDAPGDSPAAARAADIVDAAGRLERR